MSGGGEGGRGVGGGGASACGSMLQAAGPCRAAGCRARVQAGRGGVHVSGRQKRARCGGRGARGTRAPDALAPKGSPLLRSADWISSMRDCRRGGQGRSRLNSSPIKPATGHLLQAAGCWSSHRGYDIPPCCEPPTHLEVLLGGAAALNEQRGGHGVGACGQGAGSAGSQPTRQAAVAQQALLRQRAGPQTAWHTRQHGPSLRLLSLCEARQRRVQGPAHP